MARAGISPDQIDEVIFGCVLQAGQGQSVARLAAMGAGIPKEVPSFTINKMCGSGLRSVSLAAQMIKAGDGRNRAGRRYGEHDDGSLSRPESEMGRAYG